MTRIFSTATARRIAGALLLGFAFLVFVLFLPLLFMAFNVQITPVMCRIWVWSLLIIASVLGLALGIAVSRFTHRALADAGSCCYAGRAMRTALTEAVAGLDENERSQAIAAVRHGVVPTDPRVRSAAIRLGSTYLGDQSADQLKRRERRVWTKLAIYVPIGLTVAVTSPSWSSTLYWLALVLLLVVMLPLGVLRTRRIQRNVALLADRGRLHPEPLM
jgi:hypothetical protein